VAQNKRERHFRNALIVIILAITIVLLAFLGEDIRNLTGFATANPYYAPASSNLAGFKTIGDLATLSAGTYYIDQSGIVYWADDVSEPAVAKVDFIDENQKNRLIYIDKNGNVGYIIS